MIRLESLTFNNIRCFDEKQTISFLGRDKLIQVDGRNENTGGSSGAGKTTVFLALDYLLGINDIPATVLQSRLTKDSISVSGIFDVDGKKADISRSKKGGLTIKYNGETVSGNVKMAEEKLDELLGIPRKLFKKMVHKKQKDGGFFLEMTAKEIYEFLVGMLGLGAYLDQVELIAKDVTESTKTLETLKIEAESARSGLVDLESIINSKVRPIPTVTPKEVTAINELITNLEGNISEIQQAMDLEKSKIVQPKHTIVSFDDTTLNELQAKKNELGSKHQQISQATDIVNKDLSSIPYLKERAKEMGGKIASLNIEKKELEKSQCPTCQQTWVGDTISQKIIEVSGEIADLTNEVLAMKASLDVEPELKNKLARLGEMQHGLEVELNDINGMLAKEQVKKDNHNEKVYAKHREDLSEYNIKISEIKNKFEAKLNDRNTELNNYRLDRDKMSYELNSFNTQMIQYNEEMQKLAGMLDGKKLEISKKIAQQAELEKRVIVAEESKRLVKTYVLQTFQETLDLIGDMATDILSAIPNMASSTVYFEGCKENKSGGIKDEVTAIVNMDGNNKVPIKSFSGGERTAIDLAVDLAVIDIIESKTGKGADFFVIDEPFDGLDSVCKENCLEILKQVDTNKKIIMVDHSSELKEMVSDVITVVKNGESSTVAS